MNFNPTLKRFSRRVRVLRAWKGLGVGLSIGAILATVWSVLDWLNLFYTEWTYLGWLVGACGLLGLIAGALRGVSSKSLTDSIDRRADLKNRLSTATERTSEHSAFDDALRADASDHLGHLKPANLYPIRISRWHAGALIFSVIAASLFMLGNTPLLMGKEAKANRAKMQEDAKAIERVVKPLEEATKEGETNPAEKKLAQELRKLSQDLHKARIKPEEAMQRQNELSKEAEKLANNRLEQTQQNLQTAQSALEQMKKEELEKLNAEKMNAPLKGTTQEQMKDMHDSMTSMKEKMDNLSLSDEQKKELMKQLSELKKMESEADQMQKEIKDLEDKLQNKGLSDADKKALLKKLADMKKKLAKHLEMTKAMQELMDKMMNDPLMKEIQELAAKAQIIMSKAAPGASQKQRELSEAELKALQKQLDEFAKKLLADDKLMKEYLKAIRDYLKNGKIYLCNGQCMNPFGIPIPMQLPIPGGPSKDNYFANTGYINKGKGEKSQGSTFKTSVTGQSRDVPGENTYVEMRGPTGQGLRSSIPYQKVLPSYKHKADQAMNRQEIPPEHQKRVKQYFESLGH